MQYCNHRAVHQRTLTFLGRVSSEEGRDVPSAPAPNSAGAAAFYDRYSICTKCFITDHSTPEQSDERDNSLTAVAPEMPLQRQRTRLTRCLDLVSTQVTTYEAEIAFGPSGPAPAPPPGPITQSGCANSISPAQASL